MITLIITALVRICDAVVFVLFWALVIRVVISWFNPDPFNPWTQILYSLTEPLLNAFRRIFPLQIGLIDLTPVVVLIVLELLQSLVHLGANQLIMMWGT